MLPVQQCSRQIEVPELLYGPVSLRSECAVKAKRLIIQRVYWRMLVTHFGEYSMNLFYHFSTPLNMLFYYIIIYVFDRCVYCIS